MWFLHVSIHNSLFISRIHLSDFDSADGNVFAFFIPMSKATSIIVHQRSAQPLPLVLNILLSIQPLPIRWLTFFSIYHPIQMRIRAMILKGVILATLNQKIHQLRVLNECLLVIILVTLPNSYFTNFINKKDHFTRYIELFSSCTMLGDKQRIALFNSSRERQKFLIIRCLLLVSYLYSCPAIMNNK